jgi:hypothetical protein
MKRYLDAQDQYIALALDNGWLRSNEVGSEAFCVSFNPRPNEKLMAVFVKGSTIEVVAVSEVLMNQTGSTT